MNKPATHFVANWLLQPTNPVAVNLIGAGGTGSQVLTALARLNHTLLALGHAGLQVRVFDDDMISLANCGRQLFTTAEVGLPKAMVLVSRVNRFFGTSWKAVCENYTASTLTDNPRYAASMTISCTDTIAARFDIAASLTGYEDNDCRDKPLYWLDFGNGKDSGQALLATVGAVRQPASQKYRTVSSLPLVTEEYANLLQVQTATEHREPSCSLIEALRQQDLFINTSIAALGGSLLTSMFTAGMLSYRGFFLNLNTFQSQPVPVG